MENTVKRTALFNYFGEQALLDEKKTVFFCPYNVSDTVFKYIHEWIRTLAPGRDCVVCGNSTGIERYTLRLLLRKKISVILPLATVIPQYLEELNIGWKLTNQESQEMLDEALTERRLLMVASTENVSLSTPTKRTILLRNYWMRWVGNHFVLVCNDKNGYFEHLLWKRSFEVLDPGETKDELPTSEARIDELSTGEAKDEIPTSEARMDEPTISQVCDDDYDYFIAI